MKKILFAAVCAFMSMSAMAQDVKCFIDDFTIAPGETKAISVNLTNPNTQFTAFQFDLQFPDGITIALNKKGKLDVVVNEDRKEDQSITGSQKDNIYTLIAFSLTNSDLYGTEGSIVDLKVTAAADAATGPAVGKILNAKFTPKSGESVTFAEVPFNVTIGEATAIKSVKAGVDANAPVYNLAGQKVNKNFKGVVIQNGKKMVK